MLEGEWVCASSDPGEFALAVTPWIPRFALAVTSWNQALRPGGALAAGTRKGELARADFAPRACVASRIVDEEREQTLETRGAGL